MMFKRLRITGRNKNFIRGIAMMLALILALSLPFAAAAAKPSDFKDLDTTAWYYPGVSGAIRAGLFEGTSATTFSPNKAFTRAEFVTVLASLCGADTSKSAVDQFTDVKKGDWFYPMVSWAFENGVTAGISPDRFAPNRAVSREEVCVLLFSAIEKVLKVNLSAKGAKAFADHDQIADWAMEGVNKCTANGFLSGKANNRFDPKGKTTRAEAAYIFYRCYYNTKLFPDHQEFNIEVSGFALDFDPDQDYYLCQTKNFDTCKILGFTGFKSIKVEVEQYASYYPYKTTAYKLGANLKLGEGRAKITITATYPNDETKEYLIAITDPEGAGYAYAKARVKTSVNLRKEPNTSAESLAILVNNARVYYLETVSGGWCKVQQLSTGKIGYIHSDYLRWEWKETSMPAAYKTKINALKKAHPNWSFKYVDVEMTYADALEKYGADYEKYIDPLNYLNEDKIFAMLDIDTYEKGTYTAERIKAMWVNEKGFSKETAAQYFSAASKSLQMNAYYITCRAILESGYGTSKFAKGTVSGYEGYYNFFGIQCYDSNPQKGAAYAKDRNWNSQFRSIVEGANWVKDQYLDQGAITPYFFRFAGFQNKVYMTDPTAPQSEASILKKAYSDPNAKATFIIPVYREYK